MGTGDSTEQKILESAKVVFAEKGYHAARMKDISEHAGVNKALLNYYFRSKEKLFDRVFRLIFEPAFRNFVEILDHDGDIFQIIENFIRSHQAFLRKHPELPKIMSKELTSKQINVVGIVYQLFSKIITRSGVPQKFFNRVKEASDNGLIRPVDPVQLVVNIISMNILIYVAEPLIHKIYEDFIGDWDEFMRRHEEEVVKMVIRSLKPGSAPSGEENNHE